MRVRLALVPGLVAALVLGVGAAGSAPTGSGGSKDPAGDVQAAGLGLTQAEKDAVDIVSVNVTGTSTLGVFATATFKGNFQAAIGRGHLASAAAALVLRPKPGKALSAGLISVGTGKVGRLYRRTASRNVGAYRHGNTITFWILGPGYGNVKSVSIETVARAVRLLRSSAATDVPPFIGPRLWTKFINLDAIDRHVQVANPSGLTCPQLRDLLGSIDADLDDPYFALNVSADVTQALHAFRATVKQEYDKCLPPPEVRAVFAWNYFSANEVAGAGQFTGPATTFNDVRIILPSGFAIQNSLCPTQLPTATISGNRIDCSGGSLATGQPFTLNLQTSPIPPTGMGGQLFGIEGNTTAGPFTITGP